MDASQSFKLLENTQAIKYLNIAAAALVLYDLILTFPAELEFIWRQAIKPMTGLYLLCRYYGGFIVIINVYAFVQAQQSAALCRTYIWYMVTGSTVSIVCITNIVGILRLHALYGGKNKFLIGMSTLLFVWTVAQLATVIALAKRIAPTATIQDFGGFSTSVCIHDQGRPYVVAVWILLLTFSSLLFGLMLHHYQTVVRSLDRAVGRGKIPFSPLFGSFYTSGAFWYLASTLAMLAHFIGYFQDVGGPTKGVGVPWLLVAQSITGSRLILDLRSSSQLSDDTSTYNSNRANSLLFQKQLEGSIFSNLDEKHNYYE